MVSLLKPNLLERVIANERYGRIPGEGTGGDKAVTPGRTDEAAEGSASQGTLGECIELREI